MISKGAAISMAIASQLYLRLLLRLRKAGPLTKHDASSAISTVHSSAMQILLAPPTLMVSLQSAAV